MLKKEANKTIYQGFEKCQCSSLLWLIKSKKPTFLLRVLYHTCEICYLWVERLVCFSVPIASFYFCLFSDLLSLQTLQLCYEHCQYTDKGNNDPARFTAASNAANNQFEIHNDFYELNARQMEEVG